MVAWLWKEVKEAAGMDTATPERNIQDGLPLQNGFCEVRKSVGYTLYGGAAVQMQPSARLYSVLRKRWNGRGEEK